MIWILTRVRSMYLAIESDDYNLFLCSMKDEYKEQFTCFSLILTTVLQGNYMTLI